MSTYESGDVPAELAPLVAALGLTDDQAREAVAAARDLLADPAARERLVAALTPRLWV